MIKNILILYMAFISFAHIQVLAQEKGNESFYGKKMQGKRTASGERYYNDSLTCAHKTYPFGTILEVVNLKNSKNILVRVNDRGPFGRNRVIDVSYKAAQILGFISQGITSVEVKEYIPIKVFCIPTPKAHLKVPILNLKQAISFSDKALQIHVR